MRELWSRHGPGVVLLGGCAAVTLGTGLIYLPAGLIVGGVLAIAWWVLDSLDRGGDAH